MDPAGESDRRVDAMTENAEGLGCGSPRRDHFDGYRRKMQVERFLSSGERFAGHSNRGHRRRQASDDWLIMNRVKITPSSSCSLMKAIARFNHS